VPIDDVADVFDAIVKNVDDQVLDFCSYIENTQIRGHRALRRRAAPPRLPPRDVDSIRTGFRRLSARANDVVEGYHSEFQKTLVVYSALIWSFLDEIIADENDFHVVKAKIMARLANVKEPVN